MIKKRIFCFSLLFLILCFSISTNANVPLDEVTYLKYISNNNYVFVMIGDDYDEKEVQEIINGRYNKSGLYNIDDTENPLWTIDFYEYDENLFISNDGIYMIRVFSYPQIDKTYYDKTGKEITYLNNVEAINLYNKGKSFQKYYISDFINDCDNKYVYYPEGYFIWLKKFQFNEIENTLLLKTVSDNEYTIDISTGEIIKEFIPINETVKIIRIIIFCLFLIVLIILIIYLIKIRRRS